MTGILAATPTVFAVPPSKYGWPSSVPAVGGGAAELWGSDKPVRCALTGRFDVGVVGMSEERRLLPGEGCGKITACVCAGHFPCAPRTWGWTGLSHGVPDAALLRPTHVGMDRTTSTTRPRSSPAPHARGDGPGPDRNGRDLRHCAPRTWGWTDGRWLDHLGARLRPTHVGMDRGGGGDRPGRHPAPHARGDGPAGYLGSSQVIFCAPRTWGWTVVLVEPDEETLLRPTHVGMDRSPPWWRSGRWAEPHARRDGPRRPEILGTGPP